MAKKTPKDSTSNDTTSARTNPMDENKKRALAAALGQIEKQFGKGSVMRMGDRVVEPVEAIPTGSLMLDIALGIGGLPRGRICEIYGPESSGKTTLTLQVIAEKLRNTWLLQIFLSYLPSMKDLVWLLLKQWLQDCR